MSFKLPGARSQYRLLASFKLRMDVACEKLQDAMIAHSSPDESLYEELAAVKKLVAGMAVEAVNRIVLVQQADRDPLGFKALNLFEEKELLKKGGADVTKRFEACLKTARENKKKRLQVGKKPFRQGTGWNPGANSGTQIMK